MSQEKDEMTEGKVIDLYLKGVPEAEICRRTGYSQKTCAAFIQRHVVSWAREEKEMEAAREAAREAAWKEEWLAAVAPFRKKK